MTCAAGGVCAVTCKNLSVFKRNRLIMINVI